MVIFGVNYKQNKIYQRILLKQLLWALALSRKLLACVEVAVAIALVFLKVILIAEYCLRLLILEKHRNLKLLAMRLKIQNQKEDGALLILAVIVYRVKRIQFIIQLVINHIQDKYGMLVKKMLWKEWNQDITYLLILAAILQEI